MILNDRLAKTAAIPVRFVDGKLIHILTNDELSETLFSAWGYAERRYKEICGE